MFSIRRQPPPELPCRDYPLILLTGRGTSAQWHTETRTAKSEVLRKLAPADTRLDIHPVDAHPLGLRDGDPATITSRRATIELRICLTETVAPGQVFLPMHDARVNRLTLSHVDPHSRQPSYKYCAVRVRALA